MIASEWAALDAVAAMQAATARPHASLSSMVIVNALRAARVRGGKKAA